MYIFLSIFLGISFSQEYNIHGLVLDDKTKEPIDNVSIYMHDDPNLRIIKVERILESALSKNKIFNSFQNDLG